ncbi:MAG: AAA family ATPase [Patescibacteria group bacterium]
MNRKILFLEKSFSEGTNAHAYLFFGPRGSGKIDEARAFARSLTGHTDERRPNPDVLIVMPEEKSGDITIDQIRSITSFLVLAPAGGKNKVVIINEAHRMQPEAASALLKTLEEPPAQSVLILASEHPGMVLPTVLSRVQKIRFSGMQEKAVDKKDEIFYHLDIVFESGISERLALAEKLSKEHENIEEVFDRWLALMHDLLYISLGLDELTERRSLAGDLKRLVREEQLTTDRLRNALTVLVAARFTAQTTNANRRLLLENTLLTL